MRAPRIAILTAWGFAILIHAARSRSTAIPVRSRLDHRKGELHHRQRSLVAAFINDSLAAQTSGAPKHPTSALAQNAKNSA